MTSLTLAQTHLECWDLPCTPAELEQFHHVPSQKPHEVVSNQSVNIREHGTLCYTTPCTTKQYALIWQTGSSAAVEFRKFIYFFKAIWFISELTSSWIKLHDWLSLNKTV